MRIAILSAGPSINDTWPKFCAANYSDMPIRIAINSAIIKYDAEWFAYGDHVTTARIGDRKPLVGVMTTKDNLRPDRLDNSRANLQTMSWDDLPGIRQLPLPFTWTIQGAIACAIELGAKTLEMFGVDMDGEGVDAGGYKGDFRGEGRWMRERRDTLSSVRLAESMGITVNFHGPTTIFTGARKK